MSKKSIDLTSSAWRNLIFANKNQDFGAYQIRKNSDKRHNMAMLYMLIGLVVVVFLVIGLSKWSDYRAEQEALALQEQREKMMQAALAEVEEEAPEEEPEQEKFEQPEVEVPEEVLATVQVTQIAIVDADKVKNEVMDMDTQKEDNTARGVVTQEGSDDADKFKAVQEQVVVKEPEPEVKHKEEEIFVAVEQPAQFPGGMPALMKWLSNNIRYPEAAQQNDIQGKVIVKFVVEKDGSIGNVTVLKGVDRDLDREAIRVVKKMPKWQAGKNNGVAVRSYFNLPVTFKLQNQ
ncbi:MAG: energy transducer TonB [Candidatus Amulumruptor caecigallinarius]|nr:energy transducer TonB [Candidatus Amulumruptor caecigallinarius]